MTNALWLIGHLVVAGLCVPLAVVDWREHRLPNRLTLALGIAAAATVLVGASGSGNDSWATDALLGALFFAGPLFAVHLVSPSAMGFGDIKLTAGLGLLIGWYDPQLSLRASFWSLLLAAPHAVWSLVAERRVKRAQRAQRAQRATVNSDSDAPVQRSSIAFGPYLIGGAALVIALAFAYPTA